MECLALKSILLRLFAYYLIDLGDAFQVKEKWYWVCFTKDYGAECRARIYLRSRGLAFTEPAIEDRIEEEKKVWRLGLARLTKNQRNDASIARTRTLAAGFSLDEFKASFEDGREVSANITSPTK